MSDVRSATPAPAGSRVLRALARWETLLLVVLLGLIVLGSQLSPVFLTPRNFANLLAALMEVAIMALAMTLAVTQMRLSPSEAWMAATANAAAAVGAADRIGRIAVGFEADLCLYDTHDSRHIAYHYGHEHARAVVKGGRVVWERGDSSICS